MIKRFGLPGHDDYSNMLKYIQFQTFRPQIQMQKLSGALNSTNRHFCQKTPMKLFDLTRILGDNLKLSGNLKFE